MTICALYYIAALPDFQLFCQLYSSNTGEDQGDISIGEDQGNLQSNMWYWCREWKIQSLF